MSFESVQISGVEPGPRVLILGATHGNERLGVEILQALRSDLSKTDLRGTLTLVMGNPEAYQKNLRYLDTDLNRLASKEQNSTVRALDPSQRNREEKRILELVPFIRDSDYMLDIHCTIRPSKPFVFCANTSRHLELAGLFEDCPMVGLGISDVALSTGTDFLADSLGSLGHTLEAGWLEDQGFFEKTYGYVKTYLSYLGCLLGNEPKPMSHAVSQRYIIYEEIKAFSSAFEFCLPEIENFGFLPAGTIYARDENKSFRVERDSYLIFPKTDFAPGKTAVNLAVLEEEKTL